MGKERLRLSSSITVAAMLLSGCGEAKPTIPASPAGTSKAALTEVLSQPINSDPSPVTTEPTRIAAEPLSTKGEPTQTKVEPTKTPAPTETPAPIQWKTSMENVETMADCNQITDLDTQIPELHKQVLEHYRDIGLIDANGKATDKAEEVYSSDRIIYVDKTPWSFIEVFFNMDSRAVTCSTIDGNLAVTVPLRSQGSDVVIPTTFVMDQKGIENFYGPNGKNLPKGYEAWNTTKTFQRILEEIQPGKRTFVFARAWIPEATYWDAAFTYQWPESQKLLEKYNTQPGYTQLPTPDIVSQIKTSFLLSDLVLSASMWGTKFDRIPYVHAIEAELMKRNPVFPVFVMGPDY